MSGLLKGCGAVGVALLWWVAPAYSAGYDEQVLATPAKFPGVVKSVVDIAAPLPAGVAAPEACQQLRAYRFRSAAGPARSSDAEAVFVAMPGVLAGASSLEMHGLSVVEKAAEVGRAVEVWALDRRSNCVEDRTGLDAGAAAGDAKVAQEYYLSGRPADGRTFPGFKTSRQLPYLAAFDLQQTLLDYRTVLERVIPDPEVRKRKLFCGGHSLGGLLTGLLMAWDFDGDPATTGDAGYQLCAGSVALDSMVSAGDSRTVGGDPVLEPVVEASGAFSYGSVTNFVNRHFRTADLGFIGPQTMTMLKTIGLNAQLAPDADAAPLIAAVPQRGAADTALRLFHSENAADWLAPVARLRRQHLTGEALLGAFMDDNSQPLSFIQVSFGTYDRGPVARRRFPVAAPSLLFPMDTRLYGWSNYDEPLPDLRRSSDGGPYTSPASEATDVQDLARVLHSAPLDFLEAYFPTRIITDVNFAQAGSRAGDLRHIRYIDAPRTRPRLTIHAGDSGLGKNDPPRPSIGGAANVHVTLPGYNHNDVITAAPVTNTGAPEPTATAVARFLLDQAGPAATTRVVPRTGRATDAVVTRRLRDAVR